MYSAVMKLSGSLHLLISAAIMELFNMSPAMIKCIILI